MELQIRLQGQNVKWYSKNTTQTLCKIDVIPTSAILASVYLLTSSQLAKSDGKSGGI